jgi:hypothetical protein
MPLFCFCNCGSKLCGVTCEAVCAKARHAGAITATLAASPQYREKRYPKVKMNLNLSVRRLVRRNSARNGRKFPAQPLPAAGLIKLAVEVSIHF